MQYDEVGEPVPTDGIQGTPKEWGISAKRVVKYNHTRSFSKTLTPSLFVSLWFSSSPCRETPWHVAYFTREASCVRGDGSIETFPEKACWKYEVLDYATWEQLKAAHPFKFRDFNADLRYPMERMRHE
jgi:hypothetical protein